LGSYNPIDWPHQRVGPLRLLSGTQSYGNFRINSGIGGENLSANGTEFGSGVGTHAKSDITAKVAGDSVMLSGACIYPDYVDSGEIICAIEGENRVIFQSKVLSRTRRREDFSIQIPKDRIVRLRIGSARESIYQAHGAWVGLQ
jgi:hypothetical protein